MGKKTDLLSDLGRLGAVSAKPKVRKTKEMPVADTKKLSEAISSSAETLQSLKQARETLNSAIEKVEKNLEDLKEAERLLSEAGR